tara:strand:- start:533 stop:694 length:162 start_codon:yes stop_codon:yes gene_type:complete
MIFDKQKHTAPPVGIIPIKVHNHIRADNILLAMRMYLAANKASQKNGFQSCRT